MKYKIYINLTVKITKLDKKSTFFYFLADYPILNLEQPSFKLL